MKIAVNTRFLIKNKLEGIGIYTHEILKKLVHLMPQHTFYFLFDRAYSNEFIFADNVVPIVVSPPARHPMLWYWWFEKSIPKVLHQHKIDLFFSPDGFCSLHTNVPQLLTIHDIGFEQYPEHTPNLVNRFYRYFTPKYCDKAQKIITVSEFTKQEIIKYYNTNADKIEVVYNAFDNNQFEIKMEDKFSSDVPYFVFVGAVHPRKNVIGLLKAFEFYKRTYASKHKLVIIGRNAWQNKSLENFIAQMNYKDDLYWIEKCNRNELIHTVKNATALVYPSLYEGFGIPLIEAMSLGVPVIASNVSSIPEIVGNAGILAAPDNTTEIAQAMQTITTNTNLRDEYIEKGKLRARDFNWENSAKKIASILEAML